MIKWGKGGAFAGAHPLFQHDPTTVFCGTASLRAALRRRSIRLGAQTTLSNLVSGYAVLFYESYEVGDGVQLAASTGLETDVIDE